jgi:Zn ribbon nucleic-acid-binding protein
MKPRSRKPVPQPKAKVKARKPRSRRAAKIFDGIKQWWLGIIAEEEKQLVPIIIERDVIPSAGDNCPSCHAAGTIREVAAGTMRCAQCGWQPKILNPPGSPNRLQLESFQGFFDAEHKQKFEVGFRNAVARLTDRGK